MNSRTLTPTPKYRGSSLAWVNGGILQRQCACGQHAIGGKCDGCSEKRRVTLQHRPIGQSESDRVPPIVHEVLRSPGQPLDASTRAFMEPRFRHDFSEVRAHSDERAAESARAVSALAYTVGREIVFGAGQYSPETTAGRSLLAHELTHVLQHTKRNGTYSVPAPRLTLANDPQEQEARGSAASIMQGHNTHVSGLG